MYRTPAGARGSAAPATTRSAAPAKLKLLAVKYEESDISLPADAGEVDMAGFNEAPTGLAPTAKWETPGEMMEGEYLGVQEKVGPNASRLYNFKLESGDVVGVWGAEVLDNRFDFMFAQGLVPGMIVRVVYVGDGTPKPGRNAPRIFKMGFKAK